MSEKIPDVSDNQQLIIMNAANAALRHEITLDEWESIIEGKITLESIRKPKAIVF